MGSYLETEEGQVVQDFADIAKGEGKVSEFVQKLGQDRQSIHKIMPLLPANLYNSLIDDQFVQACKDRFKELDVDNSEVLEPQELFPLIVELSEAHPCSVDEALCVKFADVFCAEGDGQ